jgi:CheY-like chemotaxis protein
VATEVVTSPAAIPKGLRVLLVDDEPGVREHALALLTELACEVVSCADYRGAVDALDTLEFDLLFSDIVLADGRSGAAVAECFQSRLPGAAILLTTGYAGKELDGQAERWPVLYKPYGLHELTSAIASALALPRAIRQA